MNRFQKLLNQHSSEEVMYKKIHEVCEIKNGYTSSKKNPDYWENGTIPWFRMEDIRENGKVLSDAIQHVTPEAIRGEPFPANSFIFATSVTIGEHALIEVPFLCNQRFTNVHIKDEYKDKLHYKYLFYYGDIIDDINKRMITGESSHPSVDIKKFKNIVIPIPPMPIQQEIVRNLDTFTELTAELTARKKQYEYYKNKLLVFDGGAELYELGEILVKTRGTSITARKMKELHKDEGLVRIFAGGKTYAEVNFDDIPENDINRNPSIIVKSRGKIEFEYYDKPFSHKNEFWSYYSDNERINIKYVYYYLSNNIDYFQRIANNMQMPQISIPVTDRYKIPVPPLSEQERIVSILDKFDDLVNDISIGLPAEIEARKKQYEYYRDKLLTFKEKE